MASTAFRMARMTRAKSWRSNASRSPRNSFRTSEDLVVVPAERSVDDERHHIGDVVDQNVTTGRAHEYIGAVHVLRLEPVDRLEPYCGYIVEFVESRNLTTNKTNKNNINNNEMI